MTGQAPTDGRMGIEIRLPLVEMQKRKIMLATPMYGGQCAGMFVRSTIDLAVLCSKNGIQLQVYFLFNESLITRARNYCCDEFMRSDCTHLLFIDSDIGYNPQDVLCMLALMSPGSPYDVMAAPYPKKCIAWEKVKYAVDKGFAEPGPGRPNATAHDLERYIGDFVFNPRGDIQQFPVGAPVQVLEAGTGFMMISKPTMQNFADKYPQYMYRPDHVRTKHFDGTRKIMQYFQAEIDKTDMEIVFREAIKKAIAEASDVESMKKLLQDALDFKEEPERSLRYLSEDYWFCQLANRVGSKIWFCPWMKTHHVGTYVFSGSLADLAALGAPATADPGMLNGTPAAQVTPVPGVAPTLAAPGADLALPGLSAPTALPRVVQPSSMPKRKKKVKR